MYLIKSLYSFLYSHSMMRVRSFIHRNHWSLAVLCYPNHLYEYIKQGRTVFGVDYSKEKKPESKDKDKDKEVSYVESQLFVCIMINIEF